MATIAKAYQLQAIDMWVKTCSKEKSMLSETEIGPPKEINLFSLWISCLSFFNANRVCIDYKDVENLQAESMEARNMGFDGKQAIHPNQVDTIQATFSPSENGEFLSPKTKRRDLVHLLTMPYILE